MPSKRQHGGRNPLQFYHTCHTTASLEVYYSTVTGTPPTFLMVAAPYPTPSTSTPVTSTFVFFSLPPSSAYAENEPLNVPSFALQVNFSPDGFSPAFDSSTAPFL